MNFTVGESLIFEEIRVKVIEIKAESIVFEVLETGYEGDKGGIMEVPLSYLEENKSEIKR
ncbi:hypothetical protein [Peribacillus asahii]|uniref:hypothetical protein n=1 Tax=Peribacillus asahii TaxID=228899 RepID=UPI0020799751|nr:hypothetical protein [Peribacillus asahii]USK71971.1 hypothetical protein LIS76_09550 [Peribacillus asahii]